MTATRFLVPRPRRQSSLGAAAVAVAIAIAAAGCSGGQGAFAPRGRAEQAAAAKKPFASPDGRFTVVLPGEPSKRSVEQKTEAGNVTAEVLLVERGSSAYGITHFDDPSGSPTDLDALRAAAEGSAENMKGRLVSTRPLEVGGRPALDYEVDTPDAKVLGRAIGDGTWTFVLIGVRPDDAIWKQMLDTFTITG